MRWTRVIPHLGFVVLLAVLLVLTRGMTGSILPASGIGSAWFYTGFLLLLFAMFYVEPHYGAPRNVMTHCLAGIVALLSVRGSLSGHAAIEHWSWWVLAYCCLFLAVSWLAINLSDPEQSLNYWGNKAGEVLKESAVTFGSARVIYSLLFLLLLPAAPSFNSSWATATMVFWWLVVMVNPQQRLAHLKIPMDLGAAHLGEIIGVQARNIFLAKASPQSTLPAPLTPVEFVYETDSGPAIHTGVVLGSEYLNDQKWLKILTVEVGLTPPKSRTTNHVYRASAAARAKMAEFSSRMVGVVVEKSDISAIRFQTTPAGPPVEEGALVEVSHRGTRVFYQVVNGSTTKELLEKQNESGYIVAEAAQLGKWNPHVGCFDAYAWLPDMNTPVLLAGDELKVPTQQHSELKLGVIPGTTTPFFIDVHRAISHHLAILGITGAGKSFVTRRIIETLLTDTKVICVDFTGEYANDLKKHSPLAVIDASGLAKVEEKLAAKADTNGKAKILEYRRQITEVMDQRVKDFFAATGKLGLFELPDLSNTTFILEFTQIFLDAVFRFAKANPGQRLCIVLEEAHTVVPETSSLGDLGDYGSNKALVNKIGQIALQGRKYGVGFILVAQRTANVSKTVLTQCNSLLCFQAFDETTFRFLENHLNKALLQSLPRLKQYHAVAVGKAFRGNVPTIVDLKA